MKLSETLLNDCDEFFELITNEDSDLKLDQAIDSLRVFLEEDADGWTDYSDEAIARAVQCRLMEIWKLIPKAEKFIDPDLYDYYENILEQLEEYSGYEKDDEEDL